MHGAATILVRGAALAAALTLYAALPSMAQGTSPPAPAAKAAPAPQSAAAAARVRQDPDGALAEAQDLLRNNCADCYGRDRGKLERARWLLEALFRSGNQAPEIYLDLARAYGELAGYFKPGSEEAQNLDGLRRRAVVAGIKAWPDNLDLRYLYSTTLLGKERLNALSAIVARDACHVLARYDRGILYLAGMGDVKKGMADLTAAAECVLGDDDYQWLLGEVAERMKKRGMAEQAAALLERHDQARAAREAAPPAAEGHPAKKEG